VIFSLFLYNTCIFTRVGTYVQRGSQFCFVVLLVLEVTDIAQNTALLSNFTMLSSYCTIACTFARQPCPAALPGRLARQTCPADLPGRLARHTCQAALPGSLARQPCPATLPSRLEEKFASCFTAVGRHACSIAYFYSAGSFVQAFPAIKDIAILSLLQIDIAL
jgi:hypothetical protein